MREIEIRNRIRLSVAAYAYEFMSRPIMSDAAFDRLALSINPLMFTGRTDLDMFFMTEFKPYTGIWIRKHPELLRVAQVYVKWYAGAASRTET